MSPTTLADAVSAPASPVRVVLIAITKHGAQQTALRAERTDRAAQALTRSAATHHRAAESEEEIGSEFPVGVERQGVHFEVRATLVPIDQRKVGILASSAQTNTHLIEYAR